MSYSPSLLHLPMLLVSVNFSVPNGLFIDILVLLLMLYGNQHNLISKLINVIHIVKGEVYRNIGCIVSGRVTSNPHQHSVSSQPSP